MKKSDYEKLRKQWYKKLSKVKDETYPDGFEDIEADEDKLKTWSTRSLSYHTKETWEAKREYYQMAENFLNDYNFSSPRERAIWEYHTNGISYRDISKLFRKIRVKMSKDKVWAIVTKLENKMFRRYKVKGHSRPKMSHFMQRYLKGKREEMI